jgi:hypothetical protein
MQNHRSWESGYQSELESVCRREMATQSFIDAVRAFTPEPIMLPRNRAAAAAWSLQTVYDLAAKSGVGLRFKLQKFDLKMCRSTIYLQSTITLTKRTAQLHMCLPAEYGVLVYCRLVESVWSRDHHEMLRHHAVRHGI